MIFFQLIDNSEFLFGITAQDIKYKFPHTSFSQPLNPVEFEGFGYFAYKESAPPIFSPWTHKLVEICPLLVDGIYVQQWETQELPLADFSQRLTERKFFLLNEIDTLSDCCFQSIYPQARISEYVDAGLSAKSFIDNGYLEPVPDPVLADTTASGRTPVESADLIHSKYMSMILTQRSIRQLRINSKALVSRSTSHQELDLLDANFRQELVSIKSALS